MFSNRLQLQQLEFTIRMACLGLILWEVNTQGDEPVLCLILSAGSAPSVLPGGAHSSLA